MPTIRTEAQLSVDDLLRAVDQLDLAELERFASKLLALQALRRAASLSSDATQIHEVDESSVPSDVMELLASLPTPEEILALRPSPALQARISELLDKNRTVGLSPTENEEWQRYQDVEHLVRLAKAKAAAKIQP